MKLTDQQKQNANIPGDTQLQLTVWPHRARGNWDGYLSAIHLSTTHAHSKFSA